MEENCKAKFALFRAQNYPKESSRIDKTDVDLYVQNKASHLLDHLKLNLKEKANPIRIAYEQKSRSYSDLIVASVD